MNTHREANLYQAQWFIQGRDEAYLCKQVPTFGENKNSVRTL
jgi:hypothetical protein